MTVEASTIPAPPERAVSERLFDVAIWGGLALLLVAGFRGAEISKVGEMFAGNDNMRSLGVEFFRPNFSQYRVYVVDMWLTVQMALWGTALAIVIAIPLGLAGARNVTPPWVQ